MTTANFIDVSLHASAFPATYVPPGSLQNLGVTLGGTLTSTTYTTASTMTAGPASGDTGVILLGKTVQGPDADVISGVFTGAGNVTYIPVGFFPTKIEVIDWSNDIVWEWMFGAPSTDSMKITTATAVDTGTAITVTADKAGGNGNVTYITLSSTLAASAAVLSFRIEQ